jgi:hypothetical protein
MTTREEIHYYMESRSDKMKDALKKFESDYDIDELHWCD